MLRHQLVAASLLACCSLLAASGIANADNPLIEAGLEDPGYANVAQRVSISGETFAPGIYLGNQWFLTAAHASNPSFVQLNGQRFDVIPGTAETLLNPVSLGLEADDDIEQFNPGFQALTTNADLQLFRIGLNADGETPELANSAVRTLNNPNANRRLAIADSSPSAGADVIAIGISNASTPADGNFGTNRVSGVDIDNNNDGQNIFFSLAGDIFLQTTQNDALGTPASTEFEFQAQGGDSGSPVFVRNSAGEFEFGGVLHVIFPDVSGGALTGFTDIGNPLAGYVEQLETFIEDNQYSIQGDVNLDGVVDAADLTALAEGFRNESTEANVLSWVQGDLDQNGVTNLSDFALLRDALGGSVSLVDLNAALSAVNQAVVVPEPGSLALSALMGGLLTIGRRRRL